MVEVAKVKGELNWADILTKCIVGWEFVNKVKNIQEGGRETVIIEGESKREEGKCFDKSRLWRAIESQDSR